MKRLAEWWWRLRSVGRRRTLERGLDEELRFHIDQQSAKNRRAGLAPDEAMRQAMVRFGGVDQTKESTRDEFRAGPFEDTIRDVRYGIRSLGRTPGFTLAASLTIGLGIGAAAALFSVVNGVLIKPLPYRDAERLVDLRHSAPGAQLPELAVSAAQLLTYQEQNRVFEALGVYSSVTVAVTGRQAPEEVYAALVTEGTLKALGTPPALGRLFTTEDDAPKTPETVVLSHGYWVSRFGGDPRAIGQTLVVDARPRQVIGVMPADFTVETTRPQVILPFRFDRGNLKLGNFNYAGLARLKPGVSIAEANADLARILPAFIQSWPSPGISRSMFESAKITPQLRPLKERVVGNIGDVLWVLAGTIGIVLVIACANVANLLLVRTEGRQQELAVRSALGAGRWRVMRALLVESVVLSMLGGALGLMLAFVGLKVLVATGPSTLPRLREIAIDPVVLAFTLAISIGSGLAFGLVSVMRRSGHDIARELRGGGRTSSSSRQRHRTRHVLVVAQVGLATTLVIAAGLMVRSYVAMRDVHPGFGDAAGLQLVTVPIPVAVVADPVDVHRVQREMRDRIAALQGVTSVSFATTVPLEGSGSADALLIEHQSYGASEVPPVRWYWFVSPGHFDTLRTPVVAGRDFTWADIDTRRPVAIVSENMARELWKEPGAALGKRVRENPSAPWREVVGVVANVHAAGVDAAPPSIVYWPPLMENFWTSKVWAGRSMTFVVRSDRTGTEGLIAEVRAAVGAVNGRLPLARVRTMSEIYIRSMARTSFALVMLAIAGSMALVLSVIGIYGVLSYTVAERTREIGIRVALGAEGGRVRRMFVRSGLTLAAVGVVLGLGTAVGLSRVLASLLFGVESLDPATYAAASLILVAAAALASYIPARRATQVSPITALRAEV